MIPKERWDASLKAGAKLRFFSTVELEEIYLHAEEQIVAKYGEISFEGNTYEALQGISAEMSSSDTTPFISTI